MRTLLLILALVAAPVQAVTLRWAAQNDILTLDPHSQNHATTHAMMQYTYEGLTRYTKNYQIEPCLATSWRQISETQWRFNLRQGVKFHDGSPFTADDVVFSFGRIKQPQGTNQIYVAGIKDWWGKLDGNVTDVVYTPIKSDATRVSALLSGEVDLVTDLPTQDVERLRKEEKLKILDGHEVRTIFIGLDQHNDELKYASVKGKNPFKDVRVRRALNMAVDREAIHKVTMRGLSIPAGIMIAPGVHGYSKDIDRVPKYDPAAAKKLLAEAGYPDGFEFTLDCPNNRYVNDEKICQSLVGMWAKAGLRVKLNAVPFANFIPKILNFDSSAYMLGWGVATFDALYTLQSLVRTKTAGADGSFNLGRISDPKLDKTIDAIKVTTDPKARDALLREGLMATRDQAYYVPLHHQLRPWAMKKNVSTVHKADDRPESRFAKVN